MKHAAAAAALAVVVAAVAGCPPDAPPPDAKAFITAVFNASSACSPSFLEQAEPLFVAAQNQAQIDVGVASFARDLKNPKVTFSQKDYDACLKAAHDGDCPVLNDPAGSCALVFVGTLDEGKTCAEGVECQADLDCFQDADACGVCRTIAKEGTDCSDRVCESGDFCDPTTEVCKPKPDPTSFQENDNCSPATGCGGVLSGLACVNNKCTKMSVVADGQICDVGPTGTQYCKDSSTTHTCENGICTKRPGVGDPCNSAGACDATVAACVDGTCEDAGKAGDTCQNGNNCQLGFACKSNVCTALSDVPTPPTCK